MRIRKPLVRLTLAFSIVIWPLSADAYNEDSHRRIVESATDMMVFATDTDARPSGVSTAAWSGFIQRLGPAVTKLSVLRSGLPGAYAGADHRNQSNFQAPPEVSNLANPWLSDNIPSVCDYRRKDSSGREFNLLNANLIKIKDLPYYPETDYLPCAFTPERPGISRVGAALGWQAMSVDKRLGDQALWLRPTNAAALGITNELISRAYELSLGTLGAVVVLALDCLPDLFGALIGGRIDCKPKDAFDLARKINPVEYLQGLIPGIGAYTSPDIVGLWHFIDVDATVNRYNNVRGLFYENAGPSYPGVLDVTIMVLADILGLTLNPFESDGIKYYGRFDQVRRTGLQWQAHNLGHTEFSPVSNLARHGWDSFNGLDASTLSFPLHAIGDAAAPHHVTGTTSWGHRPFEDGVSFAHDTVLPKSPGATFDSARGRALQIAYSALQEFDRDPSIQNFVAREARGTRTLASQDDDWVFQDIESERYVFIGSKRGSIDSYRNNPGRLTRFIDQAVGHTIAFLVKAAERITIEADVEPSTLCQVGQYFTGVSPGCAFGTTPLFTPDPSPPGLTPAGTACGPLGASCRTAIECCDGAACSGATPSQSGTCSASTPPSTCGVSIACTSSADCPASGVCSKGCCTDSVQ
ncbi:MAG: hypothetical protein KIT84_13810 [Labilithrix sp.]|nr:hypothetical protein [Labilithrix sp.]MCW5812095.1 hypothetical protein [Labilithrix sp.]